MKTLLFLAVLGGTWAIAHAAGATPTVSSIIAWGVALFGVAIWMINKPRYASAWLIEQNRAHAVQLRHEDPDLYESILAQDTEGHAERLGDPDAYVAAFLGIAARTERAS